MTYPEKATIRLRVLNQEVYGEDGPDVNATGVVYNVPESLARFLTGEQDILYRLSPCKCGCGGKDSWHAGRFKRSLRNVRVFDPPIEDTRHGDVVWLRLAIGEWKHPQEIKHAVLSATGRADGSSVVILGWSRSDENGRSLAK